MIEEFKERQRQQGSQMRSIMDYTMGIVFFCLGIFLLFTGISASGSWPANPRPSIILSAGFLLFTAPGVFTAATKRIITNEPFAMDWPFVFCGLAGKL